MNGPNEKQIQRMVNQHIENGSDLIEDVVGDLVSDDQWIPEIVRELSDLFREEAIDEIYSDFEDAGWDEHSDRYTTETMTFIDSAIKNNKEKLTTLVAEEIGKNGWS